MLFKTHKTLFIEELKKIIIPGEKKYTYIDFTFGYGGHSKVLLKLISKKDKLLSYEIDKKKFLNNTLKKKNNFFMFNKCFTNITRLKIKKNLKTIILDLGYSINQLMNVFNKNKYISPRVNNELPKKIKKNISKIKTTIPNRIAKAITSRSNNLERNLFKILDYSIKILVGEGRLIICFFNKIEAEIINRFIKKNLEIKETQTIKKNYIFKKKIRIFNMKIIKKEKKC